MPKIKSTRLHWNVAMSFFFHSNLTLGALGALVSDAITDMYNSNAQIPLAVQSDIDLSDIN